MFFDVLLWVFPPINVLKGRNRKFFEEIPLKYIVNFEEKSTNKA